MPFILIGLFALFIIGWLSYYTGASVYKSLEKNGNKYARLIQLVVSVGMFTALLFLIVFFIVSNIHMER